MSILVNLETKMGKERDVGSKLGDRQPGHEKGREGQGTRPSGTGTSQPKPSSSPPKKK
jgi:hypothetical protein